MNAHDFLIGYAKTVDSIDRIAGPISASLYLTGTDWGMNLATSINTLELTFLKAPFVAAYLLYTKDYKSLRYFVPKEVATNTMPGFGYLDMIPLYTMRAKSYCQNCESKALNTDL